MPRHCFVRDWGSCWYLIPVEKRERFYALMQEIATGANLDVSFQRIDTFQSEFSQYEVVSIEAYSFSTPEKDLT